MKKRFLLIIMLLAAVAWVLSSCQGKVEPDPIDEPIEEPEEPGEGELDPTSPWNSKTVSWTIGAESPSVWVSGDSIRVFDHDFVRIKFTTEGSGASASFTTSEWTGYKPAYAVFSEGIVYCNTDEGIIRQIPVPANQELQGSEDYVHYAFPAVGKAEENGETDFTLQSMKNVTARIKFSFLDNKISALTIKGMDDEQLAGKIDVKYDDLSWTAVEGTEEKTITLRPSGDAFAAGSTVYASVLPGSFAKGIKVMVTNLEGLNVGRTFFTEQGIVIERNAVVELPDAIDTPQSPWKSSVTSINVGAEAPSAWVNGDALSVYDVNGTAVAFTTDAATTPAIFSTTEWTGEAPAYAAFTSGTPTLELAGSDAVFGVAIPAQQKIDSGGSADHAAMPAVAAVEPDATVDYKISTMTNAAGRIALTFMAGTKAKSVKIQGMDGEALAGSVSVKLSNLSCTVTAPETSVVVTPSGDAFESGSTVYASILPGTYAKGLKFIVTDTDNQVIENVFGDDTGIVVVRNQDTTLPDAVDTKPLNFPDEFVVHLDFTKAWPFKESYSSGTKEYTFAYSEELPMTFKFDGGYEAGTGSIDFSGGTGKVFFPQIEGRYLNSLVIVNEDDGAKRYTLHKAADESQIGLQKSTSTWRSSPAMHVPVVHFSPHSQDQCYLKMVETSVTKVTHIYLRYTSAAASSDGVQLGYEINFNPWNRTYNGSNWTNVGKEPFSGVVPRTTPGATWTEETVSNPYTFTQTVDEKEYTFEVPRPGAWGSHQRLWNFSGGLWSSDYAPADANILKLPRTGKLVWVGVACGNGYKATTNRSFYIMSMDEGESNYTKIDQPYFLASAKQGTGDGLTVENSAVFHTWCLDDNYSPTKDYYMAVGAGATSLSQFILIYL